MLHLDALSQNLGSNDSTEEIGFYFQDTQILNGICWKYASRNAHGRSTSIHGGHKPPNLEESASSDIHLSTLLLLLSRYIGWSDYMWFAQQGYAL